MQLTILFGDMEMLEKIDLGSPVVREGFTQISSEEFLELPDGSIQTVASDNYVHVVDDLVFFITMIHHKLKKGGTLSIIMPHHLSGGAYQDPRSKRIVSDMSFLAFNKDWREKHMGSAAKAFQTDFDVSLGYSFAQSFLDRSEEARIFAMQHYNNVIISMNVTLTKK